MTPSSTRVAAPLGTVANIAEDAHTGGRRERASRSIFKEAAMSQNGPFGIDPEDFDRVFREAGDGLRDALDRLGKGAGWATLLDQITRQSRPKSEPETAGETGDGVWAIFHVDAEGGA